MTRPVNLINSNDPDAFIADAAFGEGGSRQLRMLRVNDLLYMDGRDVDWLLAGFNAAMWRYRFQGLASQIAIAAALTSMGPSEFARIMYE